MKITYLKLTGYKYTPFLGKETFEEWFTDKVTVFKGQNGSGKSATINQLTPLPASKEDFRKNGYKEIHIEHNNNLYVLISDFTDKTKYSFIMNDVELNTAGLITAQKELVKDHFNVTQSLHDILTGIENFTDMSLNARKKLFNTITNINIDEVLRGYDKLKEEHKNNQLLLKTHLNSRSNEESKLGDSNYINEKIVRLEALKEATDALFNMRYELTRLIPENNTTDNILLRENLNKVKELTSKYRPLLISYPVKNLSHIREATNIKFIEVGNRLDLIYEQIDSVQRTLSELKSKESLSSKELTKQLGLLAGRIASMLDNLLVIKDVSVSDIQKRINDYFRLETNLPQLLEELSSNPLKDGSRLFNRERYDYLLEQKVVTVEGIQDVSSRYISIKEKLSNKTEESISCPSCAHQFTLKDTSSFKEDQESLDKLLKRKIELQEVMKQLEVQINENNRYFNNYKLVAGFRNETLENCKDFWTLVDQKSLLLDDPEKVSYLLNSVRIDLSHLETVKEMLGEKQRLLSALETAKEVESSNLENLNTTLNKLTQQSGTLLVERNHYKEELNKIDMSIKIYGMLGSLEGEITEQKRSLRNHNLTKVIETAINEIDDQTRELRMEMIEVENALSNFKSIQYTIDRLQKDIDEVTENTKVLKIALDELSPKNGLIAKSISSFLNTIILNVNDTLNRIWGYSMQLKPIDVETDALNYRFKVEIENSLEVGDVSLASKGMKNALNLAFRITIYRLLGLKGYPFYGDELDANLDDTHYNLILHLLSTLSHDDRFSQMFLVSHRGDLGYMREIKNISLS